MQKIIILLLFLLLISVKAATTTTVKKKKTKVVILGAGAAGISAAKTLTDLNIHDFIIIDAQSFIGGRVQHKQFGHSQVELGANWVKYINTIAYPATNTNSFTLDLWKG
jgi:monoamine oxidase